MILKLDLPPTSEHAAHHAASFVEAMRENESISLDYTLESLSQVDELLGRMHGAGALLKEYRPSCFVSDAM